MNCPLKLATVYTGSQDGQIIHVMTFYPEWNSESKFKKVRNCLKNSSFSKIKPTIKPSSDSCSISNWARAHLSWELNISISHRSLAPSAHSTSALFPFVLILAPVFIGPLQKKEIFNVEGKRDICFIFSISGPFPTIALLCPKYKITKKKTETKEAIKGKKKENSFHSS